MRTVTHALTATFAALLATAITLTGCAINTEPIAATGAEAADAGAFTAADAGAFSPGDGDLGVTPQAPPCDVDLTCSEGCPSDLDCVRDNVPSGPPDGDMAQSLADWQAAGAPLAMAAGTDAWLRLDGLAEPLTLQAVGADGAEAPAVVLMVYAAEGDWPVMAWPEADDPTRITIPAPPADAVWLLRVHALAAVEGMGLSTPAP